MVETLLGSLVGKILAGVLGLAGLTGGVVAVAGLPFIGGDASQDPIAVADVLVDTPVAGSEVFAAGGLPAVEAVAVVATGDPDEPAVVETEVVIPVEETISSAPVAGDVASAPLDLVAQVLNTVAGALDSVLTPLGISDLLGL